MVEKDEIIIERKAKASQRVKINMIRKDGTTFVKTRDIAELMGFQVANEGRIPKLIEE